jgi:hypothetical protein
MSGPVVIEPLSRESAVNSTRELWGTNPVRAGIPATTEVVLAMVSTIDQRPFGNGRAGG